ncbi:hypothetical protein BKA69DRAFT_1075265 [Paraphysoderma sedebokerense]|nr:hypothetical protein BKA69DRAFT_1075265 [Paraphysoderma sedebokerense]
MSDILNLVASLQVLIKGTQSHAAIFFGVLITSVFITVITQNKLWSAKEKYYNVALYIVFLVHALVNLLQFVGTLNIINLGNEVQKGNDVAYDVANSFIRLAIGLAFFQIPTLLPSFIKQMSILRLIIFLGSIAAIVTDLLNAWKPYFATPYYTTLDAILNCLLMSWYFVHTKMKIGVNNIAGSTKKDNIPLQKVLPQLKVLIVLGALDAVNTAVVIARNHIAAVGPEYPFLATCFEPVILYTFVLLIMKISEQNVTEPSTVKKEKSHSLTNIAIETSRQQSDRPDQTNHTAVAPVKNSNRMSTALEVKPSTQSIPPIDMPKFQSPVDEEDSSDDESSIQSSISESHVDLALKELLTASTSPPNLTGNPIGSNIPVQTTTAANSEYTLRSESTTISPSVLNNRTSMVFSANIDTSITPDESEDCLSPNVMISELDD